MNNLTSISYWTNGSKVMWSIYIFFHFDIQWRRTPCASFVMLPYTISDSYELKMRTVKPTFNFLNSANCGISPAQPTVNQTIFEWFVRNLWNLL